MRIERFTWDHTTPLIFHDQLRDERGEFIRAEHGQFGGSRPGYHAEHTGHGYEFVSPNVETLELRAAQKSLKSVRQQALRAAGEEIDGALGIDSKDSDVIGAWRDGAEHALMSESDADWDHLRVSGAMKGYLADQKQVLLFKQNDDGQAVMYKFERKGDLADIHKSLLADGLAFHTLVPQKDGATVYAVDTDHTLYDTIDKARHGSDVEYQFGQAEFIGTDRDSGSDREQRDDARRAYGKIVAESSVPNGQAIWAGVHRRWGEALNPDNDRFAPGRNGSETQKIVAESEREGSDFLDKTGYVDEGVIGYLTPQGEAIDIGPYSHVEAARQADTNFSDVMAENTGRIFVTPGQNEGYIGMQIEQRPSQQQIDFLKQAFAKTRVSKFHLEDSSVFETFNAERGRVTNRDILSVVNKAFPTFEGQRDAAW